MATDEHALDAEAYAAPRAGPSRVSEYIRDQDPRRYNYRHEQAPSSPHWVHARKDREGHTYEHERPSQSMLLSTQSQLDRLKSEVEQLNSLVNKLKLQEAQRIGVMADGGAGPALHASAGAHAASQRHDETGDEHARQRQQAREQETRRKAEDEERQRAAMEAERQPASDDDIVNLVRHLDSLIWMRGANATPRTQNHANGTNDSRFSYASFSLGDGPRSDQVIFTKGNLNHLARRITAWETVVRSKEDEGQRRFRI